MNQLIEQLSTAIGSFCVRFKATIQKHMVMITFSLSITLLVAVILLIVKTTPPSEVTLLTGPKGGGGEKLGKLLQQKLVSDEVSDKVELTVTASEGFEDNRRQVDEDTTGKLIGFAQDGFGASDRVRILLPLQKSYVHIIVTKELYEKAQSYEQALKTPPPQTNQGAGSDSTNGKSAPNDSKPETEAKPPETESDAKKTRIEITATDPKIEINPSIGNKPRTFDVVARLLRNLKDKGNEKFRNHGFLGPALSGTRQTAVLILQHYGVPIDEIDSGGNYDWDEMRMKLLAGDIHLAFFTSEPGAGIIQKLAKDKKFFLVGLNDVDGIRTLYPQLGKEQFFRNSYGAAASDKDTFCSTDLWTIATRRVIICSSSMSESEGYWLATQLKAAIRERVPTIRWDKNYNEQDSPTGFTYPLHPGADPLRMNKTPWYSYIPGPLWSPLIVLVMMSVIGLLRSASDTLLVDEPEPQASTQEFTEDALVQELVEMNAELERKLPVSEKEYRKLQARVRKIRRTISDRLSKKDVDESLTDLLRRGLGELQIHLEHLNPSLREKKSIGSEKLVTSDFST